MRSKKRILSLVMAFVLLITTVAAVNFTAFAAAGDKVYVKVPSSFGKPNCYMWNSSSDANKAWPGAAMTDEGDGVYSYTLTKDYKNVIFNNGSSQTDDLTYPGNNQIYDYETGKWSIYSLEGLPPVVTVDKKTGSSFKTDTVDVTITVKNADTAKYSVDNGSEKSFSDSITVKLGAGVAYGSTTTLKVTAVNENGTTEESYVYTKKQAGVSSGDGHTTEALGGYFATNPGSKVGVNKTITIDGDISDWDSSMLIAQGVANDDPRVYRPNSMYERAVDDYALYAAWDNDNLYLMWEMANVQDIVAPNDNFPLTQGNLWINSFPLFVALSIDPSIEGNGKFTNGDTIWSSGITFDTHIDTYIAFSTDGSNGPFIYKANDEGLFDYDTVIKGTASGIKMKWGNATISKNLYGIDKAYGTHNNRVPGDTLKETSAWIDFYAGKHNKNLDMFYEMAIPLSNLGTSKDEIEKYGIGVIKISTFGTSGMDCLPYDPSMSDNAALPYSEQEPNSHEKEDEDHITVPLARIGNMSISTPTPTPTEPITEPPTEEPGPIPYVLGDVDKSGEIDIYDAALIQKHLVALVKLDDEAQDAADVDKDGDVTIYDAAMIQKHLAKLLVIS